VLVQCYANGFFNEIDTGSTNPTNLLKQSLNSFWSLVYGLIKQFVIIVYNFSGFFKRYLRDTFAENRLSW